eukprot:167556-Prymnesium_polylepis.1
MGDSGRRNGPGSARGPSSNIVAFGDGSNLRRGRSRFRRPSSAAGSSYAPSLYDASEGDLSMTQSVKSTTTSGASFLPMRTAMDNFLTRIFTFSPTVGQWEIASAAESGGLQASAFAFEGPLLFVDISGFTPLCAMVDVDAVQGHMNRYFTQLIAVITAYGGDVLRFAGDALLCAWALPPGSNSGVIEKAAMGACSCALDLINSGDYYIKQLDANLTVKAGVGTGSATGMRVGTPDRWEFVLTGDPLRQATDAEHKAKPGEVICSPQVWACADKYFEGESRGDGFWHAKAKR